MTQAISPPWRCVLDAKAKVGECPIWVAEQRALYWVDAYAPSLNRLDVTSGENRTWPMPRTIGSYALSQDLRTCVVALTHGIHRFDFASGALVKLHDAPYDQKHYRFNDGRLDRAGRFWVGTLLRFSSPLPKGSAAFYRMDAGGLAREIEGVTVANSIAFSPDDRTLYLGDRDHGRILAYDYDLATGRVTHAHTFATLPEGTIPDGAAVDAEGGYWIALVRSGQIARYSPQGALRAILKAPVSTPTMVAFGGADMKTLFVTTSRAIVEEAGGLESEALAGGIFCTEVDVRGLPEPRLP